MKESEIIAYNALAPSPASSKQSKVFHSSNEAEISSEDPMSKIES